MTFHQAKPWAILAMFSLALNLFLGGVVVGKLLRPDRPPRDLGPIALLRSPQDLDPEGRKIVERVRERRQKEVRQSMRRAGESRAAAVEALCAKDFDEAKVRQAFQSFREETNIAHDKMHEALIEAAKEMSPEQRQKLKEALLKGRGWEGRGREGRDGRGRFRGPKGPQNPEPGEFEPER